MKIAHYQLHTLRCTLNTKHWSLHSAQFTLFTAQCTLHTAQYTLHTVQCTLHTVHGTLHSAHCTLHTAHCKLYTYNGTLHTRHCTLQFKGTQALIFIASERSRAGLKTEWQILWKLYPLVYDNHASCQCEGNVFMWLSTNIHIFVCMKLMTNILSQSW